MASYFQQPDGFKIFLSEVDEVPKISREREQDLAIRYKQYGDNVAAQELIEAHLQSVIHTASKYRGYRIPLADLVGEGTIGLLEALKRFEPERGLRFYTYARHWVRAYVLAYVLKQWSIVDMGTSAVQSKLFFRLQSEHARLSAELGEGIHIERKLAEKFGTSVDNVEAALARLRAKDASLDAPLMVDGATTYLDMLRDDAESLEDQALATERAELVQEAVANVWPSLTEREKLILRERLLAADDPKTLAALGRRLGVTRERVRQIEVSIKKSIRDELEKLHGDFMHA